MNAEIARVRDVPEGRTVVSPPYHRVFSTPRELVRFIARMRELSGGKPAGFKLCVGSRRQFLAVCKAMVEEGTAPDFIVVDGSEGGTGAAPLEFADHVGTPLTEGLLTVHNALVGAGLRDRIKIGASGKIATGTDLVKRMVQGADYGNAARAMMFAVGCIQAQRCHTNTCPTGVTTQDPRRARALDVQDKTARVRRFQEATVAGALQIMASMGVTDPADLRPHMLRRRVDPSPSAPTKNCTSGSRRGSCSPSHRPLGRPTGRPPTPTVSPSDPEEPHVPYRCPRHRGRTERTRRAPGVRRRGDALNPLTDAIRGTENLEWVGCRHEEAAAFAASAQSQLTGTLGVCMGTVGPGSVHLLNGLYDAAKSHAPVLAIAGQVPLAELGSDYFQEVDNDALFSDVAVFRATITSPDQLPQMLETAVRNALGRRESPSSPCRATSESGR